MLDEAYVDWWTRALKLALKYPHVLVDISKAHSLCFQRVGYFVGHDLIAALHKIRDSYNVNGLGLVAAEATLGDLRYYRAFRKIIATRDWLSRELTAAFACCRARPTCAGETAAVPGRTLLQKLRPQNFALVSGAEVVFCASRWKVVRSGSPRPVGECHPATGPLKK